MTDQVIPAGGFNLTGGSISGSFAGTGGVIAAAGVARRHHGQCHPAGGPDVGRSRPAFPQCQPTLVIKVKKGVTSATLKAPKGLKKNEHGHRLDAHRLEVAPAGLVTNQ